MLEYGFMDESFKCVFGGQDKSVMPELTFDNKEADIDVCINDFAAIQLIVRSDGETHISKSGLASFATEANALCIRLEVEAAAEIRGGISLSFEDYLKDDDGLHRADVILSDEYINTKAHKIRPVWIECNIPEGTPAGSYPCYIKLYLREGCFEEETLLDKLQFTLHVKDISLPMPDSYSMYIDLWQHLSNLARKTEVTPWSDGHFAVIDKYLEPLAEIGQKAVTLIVSEAPWAGQHIYRAPYDRDDLFEYNMVGIKKEEGGFRYDFSRIKRYIALAEKHGIKGEIEVFGLVNVWQSDSMGGVIENFCDGTRVRYLDCKDGTYKFMRSIQELADYICTLERFFIEEGLIERVRICADEPEDVELFKKRLRFVRDCAPNFRFKAAVKGIAFINQFKDVISDFVPNLYNAALYSEELGKVKADGKNKLYWYVCCSPLYPNNFIRSPLLETRLTGWLTEYLELDGFLRWSYCAWADKPRERASYRYPFFSAGDLMFVYPSFNGTPLLSLRLKALRRAVLDFELIQLARRIDPQKTQEIIMTLIRAESKADFFTLRSNKRPEQLYSTDCGDYNRAKSALIELIVGGRENGI